MGEIELKEPATPTLDKMTGVQKESQTIGEFLEWLINKTGYVLCKEEHGDYYPIWDSSEKILADYFEIDLKEAEKEKKAVMKFIRELSKRNVSV